MRAALIFLLALCAFTAAMVPRDNKRAVNTKDKPSASATVASSSKPASSSEGPVCAASTPCGWSLYNQHTIIEQFITNTYCKCSPDTNCVISENDKSSFNYVHRCRPPGSNDDFTEAR